MAPFSPHRHLTGIDGLQPHEIMFLLDEAEHWLDRGATDTPGHKTGGPHSDQLVLRELDADPAVLRDRGQAPGADVVNMHAAQSSVKKGETLIDTAMTLNAMRADVIVIRHMASGAVRLIADKVDCPVLNVGDGRHEHPPRHCSTC